MVVVRPLRQKPVAVHGQPCPAAGHRHLQLPKDPSGPWAQPGVTTANNTTNLQRLLTTTLEPNLTRVFYHIKKEKHFYSRVTRDLVKIQQRAEKGKSMRFLESLLLNSNATFL